MGNTLEQNQFFKAKSPAVREYLATAKQIEQVVAAHGHLYRPGFLSLGITEVESSLKYQLSAINYQVISDAIERELKQSGIDYDLAIKNAAIAWQLEKTTLLTDLEQEFADNKRAREWDKSQLDQLEITTNLRKLVIMAAKTAIDVEIEQLRQEMTTIDQFVFPYENSLLAAQLLTAQKKLEVIPYIEEVLAKQYLIIAEENANATRKGVLVDVKENLSDKRIELITARELIAGAIVELIAAKQALVVKRGGLVTAKELISTQERTNINYLNTYLAALTGLSLEEATLINTKKALIPLINDKSLALIAYAAELDAWIVVKEQIAVVKEEIAGEMENRIDRKEDIVASQITLNDLKLDLQEAHINLEIAKLTGRSDLLTQKTANTAILITAKEDFLKRALDGETQIVDKQIEVDEYESLKLIETAKEVNGRDYTSKVTYMSRESVAWNAKEQSIANITADAQVTSELIHLLA